eukprot:TRINITY_DN47584_c0_g1_i1.p1 TRINITY_DN47584_c0_g1~~TRINITY_DN47584_c0_g1_i1.p1  ORF type:complete len:647 (+),score=60.86 TRINITY_DN47584_c0_g1_i1:3-1943(+)
MIADDGLQDSSEEELSLSESDGEDFMAKMTRMRKAREDLEKAVTRIVLDPSIPTIEGVEPRSLTDTIAALKETPDVTAIVCADNDIGAAGARRLGTALRHNTTVEKFQLTCHEPPHNGTGDSGISFIADALKNNQKLLTLLVDHCTITAVGAHSLASLLRVNTTLTRLDCSVNNIEAEGCKHICLALRNNPALTSLNLAGNEIGKEGAQHLALLIGKTPVLQTLELADNGIGDDGMSLISRALLRNASLTKLDLSRNDLTHESARHLTSVITYNTTLSELNISHNPFTGSCSATFCDSFAENKSISKLGFAFCKLDDETALAFGDMLEKNSILRHVDLRGNYISPDGLGRLTRVMKVNRSLLSLLVFDESEKSTAQALLNKFCKRNGVQKKEIQERSKVTLWDMVSRLNWDVDLVGEWLGKIGVKQAAPIFRRHQVDGEKLLSLNTSLLKTWEVEPYDARREISDQLAILKTDIEEKIRQERGEPKEEEDEDERLLRVYEAPETIGHTEIMKFQKERNLLTSPLKSLKAELEKEEKDDLVAEEEKERAASALSMQSAPALLMQHYQHNPNGPTPLYHDYSGRPSSVMSSRSYTLATAMMSSPTSDADGHVSPTPSAATAPPSYLTTPPLCRPLDSTSSPHHAGVFT